MAEKTPQPVNRVITDEVADLPQQPPEYHAMVLLVDDQAMVCEAIRRALATGGDEGISENDLLISLEAEYQENDIFPPTDITEDWLHLIDHDSENVVKVSPFRASDNAPKAAPAVI